MDVAIVTCRELPEPDPDERILMDALRDAGFDAALKAWDDPDADWSTPRMSVLHSCWNYHRDPSLFREWLVHVTHETDLVNPVDVVRWNLHKQYLLEMSDRGIAVVPTRIIARGSTGIDLAGHAASNGWSGVVVKPAVSAGSYRTRAFRDPGELEGAQEWFDDLVASRDTMVQPFVHSVEDHGERCLVWIDGEVTHAVRKEPREAFQDECVTSSPVSDAERAFAHRVLDVAERMHPVPDGRPLCRPLVYGRVDLMVADDGGMMLSELELIEPSLFFQQCPAALERFVGALCTRLAG